MNRGADTSQRRFYALSIAFHAAIVAAFLYVSTSQDHSGIKLPAPPTLELLLPPMNATASSAPEKVEKPVEKIEEITPEKLPVMREAAQAKTAPVAVAKEEEKEKPKKTESVAEPAQEAAPTHDKPSDAPVKEVTTTASEGPAATPGGGTAGANADFNAVIAAWIEQHKRYPDNARRRGLEGTPHIRFRIDRAGRVLSYEVQQASAQPMLDKAALDTIKRAEPFPKIPPDVTGDTIEFTVPIEFSMRR